MGTNSDAPEHSELGGTPTSVGTRRHYVRPVEPVSGLDSFIDTSHTSWSNTVTALSGSDARRMRAARGLHHPGVSKRSTPAVSEFEVQLIILVRRTGSLKRTIFKSFKAKAEPRVTDPSFAEVPTSAPQHLSPSYVTWDTCPVHAPYIGRQTRKIANQLKIGSARSTLYTTRLRVHRKEDFQRTTRQKKSVCQKQLTTGKQLIVGKIERSCQPVHKSLKKPSMSAARCKWGAGEKEETIFLAQDREAQRTEDGLINGQTQPMIATPIFPTPVWNPGCSCSEQLCNPPASSAPPRPN
ncbi:hypothetical protein B0H16DRAFT_1474742 [Mycena metata]|uniref:Uncharacterized protein n=1 Tax=Mycena metata TaxID=1033252 RepID=A0AAD7HH54_9AGAR|nr:hypothetical protein B0H16DRAFT_1474742 [Mycena metata]